MLHLLSGGFATLACQSLLADPTTVTPCIFAMPFFLPSTRALQKYVLFIYYRSRNSLSLVVAAHLMQKYQDGVAAEKRALRYLSFVRDVELPKALAKVCL